MNTDKKAVRNILYMVFAYVFMLMIYAPLEIYLVNIDEYRFDVYLLVPVLLVASAIAAVIFGIAITAISRINVNVANVCWTLLFALYLYFYLQGNLLSYKLPIFDGETILWFVRKSWKI